MDFSAALRLIRAGQKVTRRGWNGRGMYIFLIEGGTISHPALDNPVEALPYIAMYTATGTCVPWLASQTDILQNDWEVT